MYGAGCPGMVRPPPAGIVGTVGVSIPEDRSRHLGGCTGGGVRARGLHGCQGLERRPLLPLDDQRSSSVT